MKDITGNKTTDQNRVILETRHRRWRQMETRTSERGEQRWCEKTARCIEKESTKPLACQERQACISSVTRSRADPSSSHRRQTTSVISFSDFRTPRTGKGNYQTRYGRNESTIQTCCLSGTAASAGMHVQRNPLASPPAPQSQ